MTAESNPSKVRGSEKALADLDVMTATRAATPAPSESVEGASTE